MEVVLLAIIAVLTGSACAIWARSALLRSRLIHSLRSTSPEAEHLARSEWARDLHNAVLYGAIALSAVLWAVFDQHRVWIFAMILPPTFVGLWATRFFRRDMRLYVNQAQIERRAQEVLSQEFIAPRRWAQRLAPSDASTVPGLEVAWEYLPRAGVLAGDFLDIIDLGDDRVALVVGDVMGHGIDPSITALLAKNMLHVFLRRYRDPAQAVEELHRSMEPGSTESELLSVFVAVVEPEGGFLRYVSAGHPVAWMCFDRDVLALSATGPLVLLDRNATFRSREVAFAVGQQLVVVTDGLAEARHENEQLGDDRLAALLRRSSHEKPEAVCRTLVEHAEDFSRGALHDDVAVLCARRITTK